LAAKVTRELKAALQVCARGHRDNESEQSLCAGRPLQETKHGKYLSECAAIRLDDRIGPRRNKRSVGHDHVERPRQGLACAFGPKEKMEEYAGQLNIDGRPRVKTFNPSSEYPPSESHFTAAYKKH